MGTATALIRGDVGWLADHYGRVLEARQLSVVREGRTFTVCYNAREFPVAPRALAGLLAVATERCGLDVLGVDHRVTLVPAARPGQPVAAAGPGRGCWPVPDGAWTCLRSGPGAVPPAQWSPG